MTTLAIIVFDGFTDLDVFLHWDLLNRVRFVEPARPDWRVLLLGTAQEHRSLSGLTIPTHGHIDQAASADAVLHASGPPTRQLARDPAYLARLALDPTRQLVCSQCSGALILVASGVLDGLSATTYPTAQSDLAAMGVEVVDQAFVAHERVATAAGCLAGVELDRWLITRLADAATADACIQSASPL